MSVALFYNFVTPTAVECPSHGRVRPARCANQHMRTVLFFMFSRF
ncbi:hypothetical protein [Burkholderia ambifaria]